MSFNTYSNYIRTLESMADQCRGMLSERTPSYDDIKILKKFTNNSKIYGMTLWKKQ